MATTSKLHAVLRTGIMKQCGRANVSTTFRCPGPQSAQGIAQQYRTNDSTTSVHASGGRTTLCDQQQSSHHQRNGHSRAAGDKQPLHLAIKGQRCASANDIAKRNRPINEEDDIRLTCMKLMETCQTVMGQLKLYTERPGSSRPRRNPRSSGRKMSRNTCTFLTGALPPSARSPISRGPVGATPDRNACTNSCSVAESDEQASRSDHYHQHHSSLSCPSCFGGETSNLSNPQDHTIVSANNMVKPVSLQLLCPSKSQGSGMTTTSAAFVPASALAKPRRRRRLVPICPDEAALRMSGEQSRVVCVPYVPGSLPRLLEPIDITVPCARGNQCNVVPQWCEATDVMEEQLIPDDTDAKNQIHLQRCADMVRQVEAANNVESSERHECDNDMPDKAANTNLTEEINRISVGLFARCQAQAPIVVGPALPTVTTQYRVTNVGNEPTPTVVNTCSTGHNTIPITRPPIVPTTAPDQQTSATNATQSSLSSHASTPSSFPPLPFDDTVEPVVLAPSLVDAPIHVPLGAHMCGAQELCNVAPAAGDTSVWCFLPQFRTFGTAANSPSPIIQAPVVKHHLHRVGNYGCREGRDCGTPASIDQLLSSQYRSYSTVFKLDVADAVRAVLVTRARKLRLAKAHTARYKSGDEKGKRRRRKILDGIEDDTAECECVDATASPGPKLLSNITGRRILNVKRECPKPSPLCAKLVSRATPTPVCIPRIQRDGRCSRPPSAPRKSGDPSACELRGPLILNPATESPLACPRPTAKLPTDKDVKQKEKHSKAKENEVAEKDEKKVEPESGEKKATSTGLKGGKGNIKPQPQQQRGESAKRYCSTMPGTCCAMMMTDVAVPSDMIIEATKMHAHKFTDSLPEPQNPYPSKIPYTKAGNNRPLSYKPPTSSPRFSGENISAKEREQSVSNMQPSQCRHLSFTDRVYELDLDNHTYNVKEDTRFSSKSENMMSNVVDDRYFDEPAKPLTMQGSRQSGRHSPKGSLQPLHWSRRMHTHTSTTSAPSSHSGSFTSRSTGNTSSTITASSSRRLMGSEVALLQGGSGTMRRHSHHNSLAGRGVRQTSSVSASMAPRRGLATSGSGSGAGNRNSGGAKGRDDGAHNSGDKDGGTAGGGNHKSQSDHRCGIQVDQSGPDPTLYAQQPQRDLWEDRKHKGGSSSKKRGPESSYSSSAESVDGEHACHAEAASHSHSRAPVQGSAAEKGRRGTAVCDDDPSRYPAQVSQGCRVLGAAVVKKTTAGHRAPTRATAVSIAGDQDPTTYPHQVSQGCQKGGGLTGTSGKPQAPGTSNTKKPSAKAATTKKSPSSQSGGPKSTSVKSNRDIVSCAPPLSKVSKKMPPAVEVIEAHIVNEPASSLADCARSVEQATAIPKLKITLRFCAKSQSPVEPCDAVPPPCVEDVCDTDSKPCPFQGVSQSPCRYDGRGLAHTPGSVTRMPPKWTCPPPPCGFSGKSRTPCGCECSPCESDGEADKYTGVLSKWDSPDDTCSNASARDFRGKSRSPQDCKEGEKDRWVCSAKLVKNTSKAIDCDGTDDVCKPKYDIPDPLELLALRNMLDAERCAQDAYFDPCYRNKTYHRFSSTAYYDLNIHLAEKRCSLPVPKRKRQVPDDNGPADCTVRRSTAKNEKE